MVKASHNLPSQSTSFIGREEDIARIETLLQDDNCRLLTLVGPGGIGKTRVSLEVAARLTDTRQQPAFTQIFQNGIYLISLQAVASIPNIPSAIAASIGCEFEGSRDLWTQLVTYLRSKRLLLILDNFEHLLAAGSQIVDLLTGAPYLKLLITSREALNLRQEWLYHVEGMPYPENEVQGTFEPYGAVQLFLERARRVRFSFSLAEELKYVIRICRLVEGMPLAIELAAAWLKQLPCAEIASEIQRNIDILETAMQDVPPRHRSMRAVFNHSWQLLGPKERDLFMKLSVFRGGFRRDAAEQVIDASLIALASLVDKSMVAVNGDGRYQIHELQRQYAAEQLGQRPELETAVRDQHCQYYCTFIAQSLPNLFSLNSREKIERIEADIDNVRAAWNWGVSQKKSRDLHKAMHNLYQFSWFQSWHEEGERLFRDAIAALRTATPSVDRDLALGHALAQQGAMNIWQMQLERAKALLQESLTILHPLNARYELAQTICGLAWAAVAEHDTENARKLCMDAMPLLAETGQFELLGFTYSLLGNFTGEYGTHIESENWYQKALSMGRKVDDQRTIADSLIGLGRLARIQGKYKPARQYFTEGLTVAKRAYLIAMIIDALNELGWIAVDIGDRKTANNYFQEGVSFAKALGRKPQFITTTIGLAYLAESQGDYEAANNLYQNILEFGLDTDDFKLQAQARQGLGFIAFQSGDNTKAQHLYQESLVLGQKLNNRSIISQSHHGLGRVAMASGADIQSRQHFKTALVEQTSIDSPPAILDTLIDVAELFFLEGKFTEAARLTLLVIDHPASRTDSKTHAAGLLSQLKTRLPTGDIEALVRSRAEKTLEKVTADLLGWLAPSQGISTRGETDSVSQLPEPLSPRELELLRLVAAGKSNREIARELILALGTVKSHLHHIYQKLGVKSRTQAVAKARQMHLL